MTDNTKSHCFPLLTDALILKIVVLPYIQNVYEMMAYDVYFLRLSECLISENSENILIKFGMGIYIKRCRDNLIFFLVNPI
jgi:hypothetical protein